MLDDDLRTMYRDLPGVDDVAAHILARFAPVPVVLSPALRQGDTAQWDDTSEAVEVVVHGVHRQSGSHPQSTAKHRWPLMVVGAAAAAVLVVGVALVWPLSRPNTAGHGTGPASDTSPVNDSRGLNVTTEVPAGAITAPVDAIAGVANYTPEQINATALDQHSAQLFDAVLPGTAWVTIQLMNMDQADCSVVGPTVVTFFDAQGNALGSDDAPQRSLDEAVPVTASGFILGPDQGAAR
jgi:hypothetical protein